MVIGNMLNHDRFLTCCALLHLLFFCFIVSVEKIRSVLQMAINSGAEETGVLVEVCCCGQFIFAFVMHSCTDISAYSDFAPIITSLVSLYIYSSIN